MSKGLETLEEIKEKYKDDNGLQRRLNIIEKELKRLEEIDNVMFLNNKKLKALQIIKEKRVWVDALIEMSLKEYNDYCKYVWNTPVLTEEEWNLLKEELL